MKRFEIRLRPTAYEPNGERIFVNAEKSYVTENGILRFYNAKPVAQFLDWSYYKEVPSV